MMTGRRMLVLALCATAFSQLGCFALLLAGGAGVSTIAYATGELKTVEPAPLASVRNACTATIVDMGYSLRMNNMDESSAYIVAGTRSGDEVVIRLTSLPKERTEIRIRIGVFGDEALSRLLLESIEQNLETPAPEPA